MDRIAERQVERLDRDCLRRYLAGERLSTLDLRGARHAAEREGNTTVARELAREIDDREVREGTRVH